VQTIVIAQHRAAIEQPAAIFCAPLRAPLLDLGQPLLGSLPRHGLPRLGRDC
jgi:hypothetical protein